MKELRLTGSYTGGRCWEVLTEKRMTDPRALENFGYKVYSQNDEDGIIAEIFKRIGTTTKEFIEFGVQNGLESNCHLLLHKGWRGLWIEGSKDYCREIKLRFRPVLESGSLRLVNAFINRDNINGIIGKKAFSKSPDLLSIDIDGNDWHIWDVISCCTPRVVCIEYNGKFPPDIEWVQPYNPEHIWQCNDWHGASLRSMALLGEKKGYRLVGTNLNGANAFFVKKELINDSFSELSTAEELYNPLRLDLSFISPGHPAEFCLAKQGSFIKTADYFSAAEEYEKYQNKKRVTLASKIKRKLKPQD